MRPSAPAPCALVAGATLVAGLVAPPLTAHDFWLEPSTHRPEPGALVTLRLKVGESFDGEPFPRNPSHLEQFVAAGAEGVRPVGGRDGVDPAGSFRAGRTGFEVVGYRSRPSFIELDAERFDDYLREEGLEAVRASRAEQGDGNEPGRELYARAAKSLLRVSGSGSGAGFDRCLGLRLELVPERDPAEPIDDEPVPFVLLWEGAPLPGARVSAIPAEAPDAVRAARTGPDGRASLALDRPGRWLVKAVHMVPARAGSGADWESLWASLTFERAPAAAKPSTATPQ